ncbi:pilus assembly protein [Porphyrobacter algicida]|uniref:Pilus assembly protein n=1 Tax=Qipengyuania algicida TaxID=1836209 RepID=A0A845ANG1_9SPHN|nr:TadE family protein [Qipengyuania algicida]MXP28518.1 pilus assembly protein [Qipengyuania algicida]
MRQRFIKSIARDRSAIAAVEFAFVAPVMIVLIMGFLDLTYQIYAQSILTGAVQQAGRNSGIEGGATTSSAIDTRVVDLVSPVIPHLQQSCGTNHGGDTTWCSTRKNYDSFSAIAPEPFTDSNHNGMRDPGECFTDINNNGSWDSDPSLSGQGGASDVAVYTMVINYPRLFPLYGLIGLPQEVTLSATTLLKNQPYATQQTTPAPTVCT